MEGEDEGAAQPWELPAPPTRQYETPASPEHGTGDAPPGYQPYRPAGKATLNRYFFALATFSAFRAGQDILILAATVQSEAPVELWGIEGWAQVAALAVLWSVATIGFLLDSGWARAVSIIADLFFVVIVLIWWSDLPDFGNNALILARNLVAPAIGITLAVRATPSRRNPRA